MLRRLFTFMSIASLLLCVATCVLWVRSYWHFDRFQQTHIIREHSNREPDSPFPPVFRVATLRIVMILPGVVSISWFEAAGSGGLNEGFTHLQRETSRSDDVRVLRMYSAQAMEEASLAFPGLVVSLGATDRDVSSVNVRACLMVVGLLVLPSVSAWRIYRNRCLNTRKNMCFRCGYDLRASPERCPECGAMPENASPKVKS